MQQSKQRLTLQLDLPASVSISEQQATEILVLKLLEDGVLSQSEAAHALGISRAELIERMHQTRVPVVAYTPEDYLSERATLQWLQEQRKRPSLITRMKVAVDASPIIGLSKIRKLRLLPRLYDEIIIPPLVYEDVVVRGAGRAGSRALKIAVETGWIQIVHPPPNLVPPPLLGTGEGEVIALALGGLVDMVVVDDKKARRLCDVLGVRHLSTGTVLKDATTQGYVRNLSKVLDALEARGFGIYDRETLLGE